MNNIIIFNGDNYYNLLFVFLLQFSVATGETKTTDNDSSLASFRSLRTLRALRPLRAISRWEGMKVNKSSTRKLSNFLHLENVNYLSILSLHSFGDQTFQLTRFPLNQKFRNFCNGQMYQNFFPRKISSNPEMAG